MSQYFCPASFSPFRTMASGCKSECFIAASQTVEWNLESSLLILFRNNIKTERESDGEPQRRGGPLLLLLASVSSAKDNKPHQNSSLPCNCVRRLAALRALHSEEQFNRFSLWFCADELWTEHYISHNIIFYVYHGAVLSIYLIRSSCFSIYSKGSKGKRCCRFIDAVSAAHAQFNGEIIFRQNKLFKTTSECLINPNLIWPVPIFILD